MKAALRRLMTMSGVLAAMALPSQSAEAKATLEAHSVGATCTVPTNEGTTTVVPCSADSWVVALQPNWSAQMVATIEYAYADDGLPLHSFRTLLKDLATLTLNIARTGTTPNAEIIITSRPTPIQAKAF
mgnify:CR=1 FL=1